MSDKTDGTEPDARLLAALERAARLHDPVPADTERLARESFTWRTIDAELAELAYDSLFDDDRLVGIRSGQAPRVLTFEGPAFAVEVEVQEQGDRRRLMGQLVPPARAGIEVRHAGGPLTVEADDMGIFSVEVEPGLVSLRCRRHEGEGPVLETAWVAV
ncbi:MAG: hypothetical protein ACRD0S_11720 [Acidimicrobiales bacterium]